MQPATTEDTSLVQEALDGNQLSFQLLIERHSERVFALCRHYTKNAVELEDIAQDVFLKAFRKLESFRFDSSFSTWLHRIAVNTSLDFLKRRGRSPVQTVEDPELVPGSSGASERTLDAPDANLEREEIAAITHEVLDQLPDIFRTVLVMREFEDMAYQEIADVLGISIGTVESRLFRARAKFKAELLRQHPEFGAA